MLENFVSVLKIIGCSFAIGFCSITGISGGILTWQGYEKKAAAEEAFMQTPEYIELREMEDARLDAFKERVDEATVQYQCGQLTTPVYEQLVEDYEKEVETSNNEFAKKALEKSDYDDIKGMLKSSKAMRGVGITLCVLSGLALLTKGIGSVFIYDGGFGDYYTFNHMMIDCAADAVDDMTDFRRKREERKAEKEQEKKDKEIMEEKEFDEEGEEVLGNIEDTCYRE